MSMSGSSFGRIFRVSTFGESHGVAIGLIVDGCPAGIPLSEEDIQKDLDRRRPGQSDVTTPRKESDTVQILSGVFEGTTTGAPIGMMIPNTSQRSKDYSDIKDLYRPGHADFTFQEKYGIRDYRGGGRSSGRETACRVAAGAIAKKILEHHGTSILSYTTQVGDIRGQHFDASVIETNPVRAADPEAVDAMVDLITQCRDDGDSIGGVVETRVTGLPVGLGEPVFDKCDAVISHAVMSIATLKGIEFGEGFAAATMRGSEHNDPFAIENGDVKIENNKAGGILGGISTGADIVFRVAVKPPSSISKSQKTVTKDKKATDVEVHGRHDPCICPRVVPVVEAMTALALVDLLFLQANSQLK